MALEIRQRSLTQRPCNFRGFPPFLGRHLRNSLTRTKDLTCGFQVYAIKPITLFAKHIDEMRTWQKSFWLQQPCLALCWLRLARAYSQAARVSLAASLHVSLSMLAILRIIFEFSIRAAK
jgi:hypothetical protein